MNASRMARIIASLPLGERFTVLATSDSMVPVINPGDHIAIRRSSLAAAKPGDIAAFFIVGLDAIVVHRIVTVVDGAPGERYAVTKAEVTEENDPWIVPEACFLGIASDVPAR